MSDKNKKMDGVSQAQLVEEDPAQTRPPAQILLEDTSLIEPPAGKDAPGAAQAQAAAAAKPRREPMSKDGVSQAELVEEDPAQTRPPAQILLEDTKTVRD